MRRRRTSEKRRMWKNTYDIHDGASSTFHSSHLDETFELIRASPAASRMAADDGVEDSDHNGLAQSAKKEHVRHATMPAECPEPSSTAS